MKYGIFTIPYTCYPIELKDYDLIYAFSEKDNVYWSTSILKSDVEKIKNKELTNDETSVILKSLKYTRMTYFCVKARDMLKDSSYYQSEYDSSKYKSSDFKVGENSKDRQHMTNTSYFVGEYEIPNKLEKIKNFYKDLYVFLDKKRFNASQNIARIIKPYDQDLFGIILISIPDCPIYVAYAINEQEEAYISYNIEYSFVKNIMELQKTNKSLVQEELQKLNFEKTEYSDIQNSTEMLSSPKNKYENKFRYDLHNEMDYVYHGMGHAGFYIGNYKVKNKE